MIGSSLLLRISLAFFFQLKQSLQLYIFINVAFCRLHYHIFVQTLGKITVECFSATGRDMLFLKFGVISNIGSMGLFIVSVISVEP